MGYGITIRVTGPRACFTRPEMHAERVSYDVITPSAARGILEAVYWKPAIRWVIDGIEVLAPIKFGSIRRNEVASKISYSKAKSVMKANDGVLGLSASTDRQQRNTLYLENIDYVISAHFEMTDAAGPDDTEAKHFNIALRRLRKGQCFNQPYLGCREFPATVSLVEGREEIPASHYAEDGERDLGFMLYDMEYDNNGPTNPLFFRARMINGFIDVAEARTGVVA